MTRDRFIELYRENAHVLDGYARNLARNSDDAGDLLQEALLKAWAARSRYVEGTNFRAWLCTIVRHEFFDRERLRRARCAPCGRTPAADARSRRRKSRRSNSPTPSRSSGACGVRSAGRWRFRCTSSPTASAPACWAAPKAP